MWRKNVYNMATAKIAEHLFVVNLACSLIYEFVNWANFTEKILVLLYFLYQVYTKRKYDFKKGKNQQREVLYVMNSTKS
jgi:hypothetical protein